ncbi:MAG: DUF167 domain-containing protein [Betaproteobacteria bacterium]|nr:DUF167 domain-containing protein [Betaproteobacteria bacterium]
MAPPWCSRQGDDLRLAVYVQPNAATSAVVGEHDGALKLKLKAPPVDGKANDALQSIIAELLGVARRDVSLLQGLSSRKKVISVKTAMSVEQACALLTASAQ